MTRAFRSARILPFLPLLALLTACGGGGGGTSTPGPVLSTTLHYVNPVANGANFQLVVEPTSNDTAHLLLDLVGPTGLATQGVACFVTAGAGADWGNPGGTDPHAKNGTALTLGTPALFKTKLNGGNLQVGIFQTGAGPATLGAGPIVTLALDLPASPAVTGTAVTLAATPGKTSAYVDGTQVQRTLTLDLGTLTAK